MSRIKETTSIIIGLLGVIFTGVGLMKDDKQTIEVVINNEAFIAKPDNKELTKSASTQEINHQFEYNTLISEQDRTNARGTRNLRDASQRISQDRANFHRFKNSDPQDQSDQLFTSRDQRQWLIKQLRKPGAIDPEARKAIESDQEAFIKVRVWSDHVKVSLVR